MFFFAMIFYLRCVNNSLRFKSHCTFFVIGALCPCTDLVFLKSKKGASRNTLFCIASTRQQAATQSFASKSVSPKRFIVLVFSYFFLPLFIFSLFQFFNRWFKGCCRILYTRYVTTSFAIQGCKQIHYQTRNKLLWIFYIMRVTKTFHSKV